MPQLIYTYFAQYEDGITKIGATNSIARRFKLLKKPRLLFGFAAYDYLWGYRIEGAFHRHFAAFRQPRPRNVLMSPSGLLPNTIDADTKMLAHS